MAKFNKGDVSEGILAAAITARFISKTKRITEREVLDVIKKLGKPKGTKSLSVVKEFPSPNKNPKIEDSVICQIGLAEINMKALLDTNIYKQKDIKELVAASIAYANGDNIMEWADMMYNNNKKNVIEVKSDGLLDQTGTKVDLRVIIDGKQAGVGISLKAGDVKQFGQVGGGSVESMKEFFGPLGVVFTPVQLKKLQTLFSEDKTTEALCFAYEESTKQMKKLIKTDQNKFKKNLSDFIKFHATRNEKDVVLVQLNKQEAAVYNFDNISTKLRGINLDVVYSESATDVIRGKNIPQIKIINADSSKDDVFLQLRNKLEGNRINSKGKKVGLTVRNYVEKGHLTTQLLAEKMK